MGRVRVAIGVGLALVGCGGSDDAIEGVATVDTLDGGVVADAQPGPTGCQTELGKRGVAFVVQPRPLEQPAGRPDLTCLIDDPVLLQPVINGITFRPDRIEAAPEPMFATCALALAMERMSRLLAQRGVTEVVHFGIYGCRVIAGTDMLSEHARARALDVAALKLSDGTTYAVLTHWEKDQPAPASPGGRFLREVVTGLFDGGVFNIILTPDFNTEHHNHFHLDLTPDTRLLK